MQKIEVVDGDNITKLVLKFDLNKAPPDLMKVVELYVNSTKTVCSTEIWAGMPPPDEASAWFLAAMVVMTSDRTDDKEVFLKTFQDAITFYNETSRQLEEHPTMVN